MSNATFENPPNPYVGAQPFSTRDKNFFFGRKREIVELYDLLVARRVVLLYSPSGAGKTSLVQAGVVPMLCEQGFSLLPTLRVNIDRGGFEGAGEANRYVLSSLLSLEGRLPHDEQLPLAELASMELAEYLAMGRGKDDCDPPKGESIGQVLVFDQFEEVLSLDPTDVDAKQEFFRQLGRVLEDKEFFVLIAMREDYVASLDPYLRYFPDGLSNRYRISLLGKEAALLAVRMPALKSDPQVDFIEKAAEELIEDLRQTRVQQADGSLRLVQGPYIEPIMLQLVCERLWKYRSEPGKITLQDLKKLRSADQEWLGEPVPGEVVSQLSTVDLALGAYYASKVAQVAQDPALQVEGRPRTPEHAIRDWIDHALITAQDLRSKVLKGPESTQGMDNTIIQALVDAKLVRGEDLRGLTWYELIHDRLIEPVRQNNSAWFKKNLKPLQRQAMLWEREGRPQGLLMTGETLEKAENWIEQEAPELTKSEADLLKESQAEAAAARRELRRLRIFVAVVAFLALLAGVLAVSSFVLRGQAQRNERKAFTQEALAITNQDLAMVQEARATSALATAVVDRANAESNAKIATAALATAVADRATATVALGDYISARATANANLLALADAQGQKEQVVSRSLASAALVNVNRDPELAGLLSVEAFCAADTAEARNALLTSLQVGVDQQIKETGSLPPPVSAVQAVAISPDGERIAWGTAGVGFGGGVVQWNMRTQVIENSQGRPFHSDRISAITFSPDGSLLATASPDRTIVIRSVENPDTVRTIRAPFPVFSLAFHPRFPEDPRLAAGVGVYVWVYDLSDVWNRDVEIPSEQEFFHDDYIFALGWSPDGELLASGDADGELWVTEMEGRTHRLREFALDNVTTGVVFSVAWSPRDNLLASAGSDNKVTLWDISTFKRSGEPLPGHGIYDARGVSFSADGSLLASVGNDDSLVVWDVNTRQEVARLDDYFSGDLTSVAFSPVPGSTLLIAGNVGSQIGLFDVRPAAPLYEQIAGEPPSGGELIAYGWEGSGAEAALLGVLRSDQGWTLQALRTRGDGALAWEPIDSAPGAIASAAISPDGRYVGVGLPGESQAQVYEISSRTNLQEIALLDYSDSGEIDQFSPLRSLAFLPVGPDQGSSGLAAGLCNFDKPGLERCADSQNYILLQGFDRTTQWILNDHTNYIDALAFDPGRRYLASGELDSAIIVWDLLSGPEPAVFKRLRAPQAVTALAWSLDGHTLAAAFSDGTIQLYDAPSFLAVGLPLSGPPGAIRALTFDYQNRLVSSSGAGTVLSWLSTPNQWSLRACHAGRGILTEEEWADYLPDEPYSPACQNLDASPAPGAEVDICGR